MTAAVFAVGDRVHVLKECNRGCCTEMDYYGVIEARGKWSWSVRRDRDGWLDEVVFETQMTPMREIEARTSAGRR